MTETDRLDAAFEIRARKQPSDTVPGLFVLTLEHVCEAKKAHLVLELDWKRCPWCSRRVPERIRRIFAQK